MPNNNDAGGKSNPFFKAFPFGAPGKVPRHPAPPVRHRRRPARTPFAGARSTTGAGLHVQEHGVVPRFWAVSLPGKGLTSPTMVLSASRSDASALKRIFK